MLGKETKVEAQSKKLIRRDTINPYLTRNFSRKKGEIWKFIEYFVLEVAKN